MGIVTSIKYDKLFRGAPNSWLFHIGLAGLKKKYDFYPTLMLIEKMRSSRVTSRVGVNGCN